MKTAKSLCPVCYKEVDALISFNNESVWMYKDCSEHGHFSSKVEDDIAWYEYCMNNPSKNIYDGYMIDVTDTCNLSCKYCYHPLNKSGHKSVDELVLEAIENINIQPFILSGGEPTLHPELPLIISNLRRVGRVSLLTNGIKLCNEKYLDSIVESGVVDNGYYLNIVLSMHKESEGKDIEFLSLCRHKGYQVASAIFVIDSINQIDDVLFVYKQFKDVLRSVRIHSSTGIWNDNNPSRKIFVSNMLNYLSTLGELHIVSDDLHHNKVSYANAMLDGEYMIYPVCWYDVNNIDLDDIDCAPFYKANDGTLNNIVTSFIINERMSKCQ